MNLHFTPITGAIEVVPDGGTELAREGTEFGSFHATHATHAKWQIVTHKGLRKNQPVVLLTMK